MQDYLTLQVKGTENKRYLFECSDSASPTGKSLLVRTEATHAALINGNCRFYRPDRMSEGAHTFLDKSGLKFPKPVLLHHNPDADAVGRIHTAKYVDTRHLYLNSNPQIQSLCFYDSTSKKLGLFDSVDYVSKNLQTLDEYRGLGYIELGMNITNPEAIDKVFRDEYLSVSVGFRTDSAICSVCHTDWAVDDRCEHKPGEVVDGKKMFLISGQMDYKECSFVNFPADPFAKVIGTDSNISDSLKRIFYIGLPLDKREKYPVFTDALDSDIRVDDNTEDISMDLTLIGQEIRSAELTKERALEINSSLSTDIDGADKKVVRRLRLAIGNVLRKKGWADAGKAITREQVESKIAGCADHIKTLSELDQAAYLDQLGQEATAFGLKFDQTALQPQEAMPGNPAPEQASQAVTSEAAALVEENGLTDSAGSLAVIESIQSHYSGLEDATRPKFRGCLGSLLSFWDAESWLAYMKKRLEEKDFVVLPKAEYDHINEDLSDGQDRITSLEQSNSVLVDANKTLVREQKTVLAQVLVTSRVLSREPGYENLNSDQIQEKIQKLSQRQLVSLQDALEDTLQRFQNQDFEEDAEKPEEKPEESVETSTEDKEVLTQAAQEVSDSASVDAEQTDSTATDQESEPEPGKYQLDPRLVDHRAARLTNARSIYQSLKTKLKTE